MPGEIHKLPINADNKTKNICPTLDHTCCSNDQLSYLVQSYQSGNEALQGLRTFYKEMITVMNEIDNIRLDKEMRKLINDQSDCMNWQEYGDISVYMADLSYLYPAFDSNLQDLLSEANNYYSGLACSICNPLNNNAYEIKGNTLRLSFSPNNYRNIMGVTHKFLNFLDALYQLSRIGRAGHCLYKRDLQIFDTVPNMNQLDEIRVELIRCGRLSDQELIQQERCISYLNQTGYFNEFNLTEKVEKVTNKTMEGLLWLKEFEKYPVEEKYNGKVHFYELNPERQINNVILVNSSETGIDLSASKFSKEITKGVATTTSKKKESKSTIL